MKSITNFETFKLNKVQMNAISGGAKGIYCSGIGGETAHFLLTDKEDKYFLYLYYE